ncbi:MAG: LLM class flavin-dependent oxidoreductase [Corynebacteriales bacterium]|nr:LLM class flavin-dependent oxidoreductase [Mycobacteriales bacterium]
MTTSAIDPGGYPRRYSLFLQVRTGEPTVAVYRRVIEIAVAAERLGFDTIWVAARHFGAHHAAVPSLFPVLSAIAQHTTRLRLGTGVVALPFENPVRLVEDAAVTDHLSEGRVEFGVGKGLGFGLSASTYTGFGLSGADREHLYRTHLDRIHRLTGTGTVADAVVMQPDPTPLRGRIWQSTGDSDTARRAGSVGDGLLPHANSEARRGSGVEGLIDTYLDAHADAGRGAPPRIGTTIGVLPGDARRLLTTDRQISPGYYASTPAATDPDRYLREVHVHHGSTARIVDTAHDSGATHRASDLLFSVPLALHHDHFVGCLEAIAGEIAPALTAPAVVIR